MTNETIVAVYDSADHAALAVRDLEAAGVPSAAITQHAKGGFKTGSSMSSPSFTVRVRNPLRLHRNMDFSGLCSAKVVRL